MDLIPLALKSHHVAFVGHLPGSSRPSMSKRDFHSNQEPHQPSLVPAESVHI